MLSPTDKPLLSICIPTYNRAPFLRDCLASLERAGSRHWEEVEVLISDNDSSDNTAEVVAEFQQRFPLRYFKNQTNIGGEPNFFVAASRASAEHVWIFGDDDEFIEDSITAILPYIRGDYDLVVANFSSWSPQMDDQLKPAYLPWPESRTFTDPNQVLSTFRMHLGFISSVVVRKRIMLAALPAEYEPFIRYGFPHPYSIYCGLLPSCRVAYDARPLFKRRADNCISYMGPDWLQAWIKTFLLGTAEIFETLEKKGYSARAVKSAKNNTLGEYRAGIIIPDIDSIDRNELLRRLWVHYHFCWHFWTTWVPALLMPRAVLRAAHKAVLGLRRRKLA